MTRACALSMSPTYTSLTVPRIDFSLNWVMAWPMVEEIALSWSITGAVPSCSTAPPSGWLPPSSIAVIASANRAAVVEIWVRSPLVSVLPRSCTNSRAEIKAMTASTAAATAVATKVAGDTPRRGAAGGGGKRWS